MKLTLFATFLVFCSACNSMAPSASASSPHDDKGSVSPGTLRVKCSASNDVMDCLRKNCTAGQGQFNEEQKRCECGEGKVLATYPKFGCTAQSKLFVDSDGADYANGSLHFQSNDSDPMNEFIETNKQAFTGFPQSLEGIVIMAKTAKEMLDNAQAKTFLGIPTKGVLAVNFMNEPQVLLNSTLNSGVSQAMPAENRFYDIGFFSKNGFPATGNSSLDQVISSSLQSAQVVPTSEYFTWYSEFGCIDQCVAYSNISEDNQYLSNRFRMYFSGGVIHDSIRVFDKSKHLSVATLFLFNGKLSYAVYQEGKDTWLHSNETSPAGSRIQKLQTLPDPNSVPGYQLNTSETPVAVFETLESAHLDGIIPRGPWTTSHLYGWFKPEDNVSFFEGYHNLNTNFGEDDVSDVTSQGHAAVVVNLSSDQYTHPIIPFQDTALMNGAFKKFLSNYLESGAKSVVASISEAVPMSDQGCRNSPIAHSLLSDPEHLLTAVGAGNSGGELNSGTFACPQTLQSNSLIHVASSADGNSLASSSTRGANSVDIAELGCVAPGDSTCGNDDAATSFAAPRFARKLADLVNQFPDVPLKNIRFAALAAARAPNPDYDDWTGEYHFNPLAVRSGGFMDKNAAADLLSQYAHWPVGQKLNTSAWINLLSHAKSRQYSGLTDSQTRSLVSAQAAWFQSHSGVAQ